MSSDSDYEVEVRFATGDDGELAAEAPSLASAAGADPDTGDDPELLRLREPVHHASVASRRVPTRTMPAAIEGGVFGAVLVAEPGEVVAGRYRIVELIGAGAMGEVYRARQLDLKRDVAIKFIAAGRSSHHLSRDRFEREAKVAASLQHPGVVSIFDFGVHRTSMYLVMELVRGKSLGDALDDAGGHLPLREVVHIGERVADILAAAHQVGVVHRDLKPDNVVIELDAQGHDRVRLLDFGLAFVVDDAAGRGRITHDGSVAGTPAYMAPEQVRAAEVGPAADMYALGCMLFELIAGDPPFGHDGVSSLLVKHLYRAPPSPRLLVPHYNVPSALDELILELLSKVPEARPTASEVREFLSKFDPNAPQRTKRADASGRAARMVSEPPASPVPSQRAPLLVAVVGALDEMTLLGLASHGIAALPICGREELNEHDAVLLVDPFFDEVAPWLASGAAIVVAPTHEALPITELTRYLRSGVDAALAPPLTVNQIAKQIRRAVRKRSAL